MIESFRHKGLKQFYEKSDRSGLSADHVEKIKRILSSLEAAEAPDELDLPTFHFHSLTAYCSLNILEVSLILLYRCKLWHPCSVVQGFWFAGAIVVLFAV